jgi:hypothetical protein
MRRLVLVLAATVLAASLGAGCAASPRSTAFDQFVAQLEANGGLTHGQAECVATKFFDGRTDQQLKEFFARKDLTDTESAEFARLGTECAKVDTTQP